MVDQPLPLVVAPPSRFGDGREFTPGVAGAIARRRVSENLGPWPHRASAPPDE